uniref:Ig-like domain-containing protein n=1 Tax=Panthera leo TaxID=9689 RepID=A0A8C8WQ40_PANLE
HLLLLHSSFPLSPGPLLRVLGYQLELQESVTVQEGLCVHVRCRFFLSWFSFGFIPISWFQKGANVYYDPPVATNKPDRKLHERTQGRFFLLGDPQTKDCSLYITDVNMGDSGTYFLRVETHSYLYNMLSLNVTALETLQNTSNLLIREGQDLRLLCAAAGNPPAELSWFRGSPALNATPMYRTHILELPQVGAAEEGVLTCRAQNSLGSQHVSLRLSVVCECGDPRGGVASGVLGAVGGAGIMTLLFSLCLCLIFSSIRALPLLALGCFLPDPADWLQIPPLPSTQAHRHRVWTDIPADPPAPAGTSPISGEEQELHYAFLRFPKLKPREQEGINTEYSEIKTYNAGLQLTNHEIMTGAEVRGSTN